MVDLKFETTELGNQTNATVIWLHGLGADGFDFQPIVPQLGLPNDANIRFIFPHAPAMPVTMNGGYIMPAWYDLYSLKVDNPDTNPQDEQGIKKSAKSIQQLIQHENTRGIPNERIILVGFSQGGAMALYTGLTIDQPLAGIMGLSCYLPLHNSIEEILNPATKNTPVFMAHGTQDPVVLHEYGKASAEFIKNLGYQVSWREYPMEHSVCPDEIHTIGQWISSRLINQT
ncbi:alpha/beta hydrolase [Ghiorsea bivora]|uniref:alpha/beta hydrolase n=1 Tax=Ghiorsea bivora TaxID=1485545 RepID=UPI00056E4497|nr:dienelactone hydrolase family protein [Ghiorsea bivora]